MYFCKVFGRKTSSASAKGYQEGAHGLYTQVDLILKKLGPFLTGSKTQSKPFNFSDLSFSI